MPCSVCTCSPQSDVDAASIQLQQGKLVQTEPQSSGNGVSTGTAGMVPRLDGSAVLKLQRNLDKKLLIYLFWVKIRHLTTSAPDGKVLMSLSKGNRINEIWFLPPSDTISQLLPLLPFTVPPHLWTPLQAFNSSSSLAHRPTTFYSDFWTTYFLFCLSSLPFPVTPAFFHIWPELRGWPGDSSSPCSGFAKVLLRWSVHLTLGQILPAFPTESTENTIIFPRQCLSSFRNPLTTKKGYKTRWIYPNPTTNSIPSQRSLAEILALFLSSFFLTIQTHTGIREGFTEAHISNSAEEFKGSHGKHSLAQELPPSPQPTAPWWLYKIYLYVQ